MEPNQKEIIPVVFATDDGYAPYLGVALQSLIANTTEEYQYHVYILYTSLSNTHRKRLKNLEKDHVFVDFIYISSDSEGLQHFVCDTHPTIETTYRLYIPDLLPQYDKVLYLDCDIVILADVAELFHYDIGDCVLGVAELAEEKKMVEHLTQTLKVAPEDGFIAGILLLNCKEFKKQHIKEKCFALLEEDWKRENIQYIYPDQDVLILTCQGKLAKFPMAWNFEWCMNFENRVSLTLTERSQVWYDEAKEDLKIIHFTSPWKAWDAPDCEYAEWFWKYARETVFYEEILFKEIKPKRVPQSRAFPWKKVTPGSLVVIYGAGHVGCTYLEQITWTAYCHLVAFCDSNAENMQGFPFPLVSKEELGSLTFDSIVIAVQSEEARRMISKDLMELGISADKII